MKNVLSQLPSRVAPTVVGQSQETTQPPPAPQSQQPTPQQPTNSPPTRNNMMNVLSQLPSRVEATVVGQSGGIITNRPTPGRVGGQLSPRQIKHKKKKMLNCCRKVQV
eukprot:UN24372